MKALMVLGVSMTLMSMSGIGQNFQNIYDPGYGLNDNGYSLISLNNGYMLNSASFCLDSNGVLNSCNPLIKTGIDGELEWIKIYQDYPNGFSFLEIVQIQDEFLTVGNKALINGFEPFMMKLDLGGDSIWYKPYQSPIRQGFSSINALFNNNFMVMGSGKLADTLSHLFAMKVDSDGNEIWTKIIESGYPQNYGGNFAVLPNGDMVFGIDASLVGDLDDHATVVLTDSLGNTKWAKSYYTLDFDRCDNAFVQPLPNGGFVLQYCLDTISQVYNTPTKLWGLDSLGEVTWTLTFPFDAHRTFRTMSASNGDVVGCGRMYVQLPGDPQGDYLGWLWRVSPQGQMLWQRAYKPTYYMGGIAWLVDLVEAPDGGIAAIGITEDTLAGPGGTDVWLVKVGPDGCFTPGCTEEVIISDVKEEGGVLVSESEARPRVFPNPATGQVTVALPMPLPQPAIWHLHDALGREVASAVLSAGQREAEVALHHLPPGLYFWQVGNGEGLLGSGKLIIAAK